MQRVLARYSRCCRNSVCLSIYLSVCRSVRPSHAYFVTKRKNILPLFWYHVSCKKAVSLWLCIRRGPSFDPCNVVVRVVAGVGACARANATAVNQFCIHLFRIFQVLIPIVVGRRSHFPLKICEYFVRFLCHRWATCKNCKSSRVKLCDF